MDDFFFEAESAVIPILGSRWDSRPEDARIYYQNDAALALYGELRGILLADLFSEVLNLSKFNTQSNGDELLQTLIHNGYIRDVLGTLNKKRVKLFSAIQKKKRQPYSVNHH